MGATTSKANKLPNPKMEALCVQANTEINDVLIARYNELRKRDVPADRAHAVIEAAALRSYYDSRRLTEQAEVKHVQSQPRKP